MRLAHFGLLGGAIVLAACGAEGPTDLETGSSSQALGVTGPAFYVEGELYRTVGTPTDFSETGAPEESFDIIYALGGLQPNVAESGPGIVGFNGGRWMVHAIEFVDYEAAVLAYDANDSGDFDSAAEIEAALDAGDAIDLGVVKQFECPVIHVPKGKP